ncbi:MAG: NADP-dependent oxidoreductase [Litoreibacter sp.]|uniref:NADP-dependent oxidoreductase n=1 Tax=Litoreibacter sp. TaxID=1969459 RepID=UPI003297B5DF
MKTVILNTYGPASVLVIADMPNPKPKPGEVLIRVQASSVNPVDLGVRSGNILPAEKGFFPMTLGWDAAGIIEKLGAGTEGFKVGDHVMAISPQPGTQVGTHAEFVALPIEQVVKITKSIPFTTAAALPLVGSTALAALQALNLPKGASVMINNPDGAVGAMAATIAPLLGLRLAEQDETDVDGAVDVRGNEHAQRAFVAVRDGGVYATIVPDWWKPNGVFTASRGITPLIVQNPANQDVLAPLAEWLEQGILKQDIEDILPLDQIADAHRRMEAPGRTGKLVLRHFD